LATREGGLIIIDFRGHLKHIYDKSSGLQDNNVKHVFEDSTGCLWLALNNGISKIEYNSPFSLYDDRNHLEGVVYSIVRHRCDLYVGTSSGLFLLPFAEVPVSSNQFKPIDGITGNCWSLFSIGDSLIAAADSGIFQVENQRVRKVTGTRGYCLSPSHLEPGRIWIGSDNGIYSLYFKDNRWQPEYLFDNINMPTRTIIEDKQGHLWLGTLTRGTARVEFTGPDMKPIVKPFSTSHGLPAGEIHVFKAAGQVIFATEQGLFHFNEPKQAFVPDYTLGKTFAGGGTSVFRMAEDSNKHIWFHSRGCNYHAELRADGSYSITQTPFLRIPVEQVNTIYPEDDIVWFGSVKGLICYDKKVKKNYRHQYRAFIRKVQLTNSKSLVFDGYQIKTNEKPLFPVIDYRDRNLRFHYAAPFFENESAVRYSYFLEGYDDGWSDWTNETRKDYTNLDAMVYTFRARAKNVYEHLSEEAAFQFKVLPPWFQTWWAFLIYGATVLLIMYMVVRWRSWRLVQEKQKLEHIIAERTEKINHQKQQLLEQAEQLKELDEAKSRFFANISHEFRTPLTLIMGPLEKRLSIAQDKQDIQEIRMMLRNSRRLLNLINQLLELARLDSGKMKLQAAGQNIVPFLKNIVMCFESLAAQNKVDLVFHKEKDEIMLYFDPEKLEKIITNLVSNAFNYTPGGGSITVSVRGPAETGGFPSGCVEISVRDTGTGIPAHHLPHIFDRFYRVEGTYESKRKGSGIGLALTKELVDLHHGEIQVKSSCRDDHSRGSEFLLRLPPGKEHLQPEEIVEEAQKREAGKLGSWEVKKGRGERMAETTSNEKLLREVQEGGFGDGTPALLMKDDKYAGEEEESEEVEEVVETVEAQKEEKPLILVVDDNADVRTYIRGSLEPYFKVVEAADGKEGILRAREIIPDLIVSDVMMPVTDGFELCRTLKNDVLTSHVPIILLTAKVSEESELEGLATGADDYITKPFSTSVLAVRVKNMIDLRRQLQLEQKNRMTLQPEELPVSPLDDEFYKKLLDMIEVHLSDADFNVEALSRELEMSQATLYRKIHALTGQSPTLFLRSFRIKRAAQLLAANAGSAAEVADKVGFPDKSYFARCFKEQFNRLPSDIQASGSQPDFEMETEKREAGKLGSREAENNEKLLRGVQGGGFLEKSPPGRQEIILVVEDSEDARGYIRESLETGYRVVEAVDGSEGIARAMEIIPDLIVSDIMMPGTDGYELCRVLKKDVRTCHIPIVLLTAKATEEGMIRGLETGADDYITKPFNTNILLARIKNLIQLRSHLQNKRNREMTLLPAKASESEIDREFLKELNTVIEKNLEDPEFNVEQLAKKLYMSSATLYRKIQALSGEIPSEYIRSYRLHKAAQLFKDNFGSVTEVAFEVGFTSRAYFTKCFKEKFHQLPSVYMSTES
jgi:DNA-binding response OmpR family regulator/signal transduction histidine kinase